MTSEQSEASKIRAKNWQQEQPPWEDFSVHVNKKNSERRPPSAENIKRMDQCVEELAAAFAGSELNWHLDGALNISLMREKGKNGELITSAIIKMWIFPLKDPNWQRLKSNCLNMATAYFYQE